LKNKNTSRHARNIWEEVMTGKDDLAAKFSQLNVESATKAAERKERARKFSGFHESAFKEIEGWVAEIGGAGIAVRDKHVRPITGTDACEGFSSRSLYLTQSNLSPLRIEAVAWNRIDFHDVAERAALVFTTRGSEDAPVHDLTIIPVPIKKGPFDRPSSTPLPLKKGLQWSQQSFRTLLEEWINSGKK